MFKRMAGLLVAAIVLTGAAQAQAPARSKAVKATAATRRAYDQKVAVGVAPIPPDSQPRMLAPDQFPTNVVKILRTSNKAETNTYVPVVFDFKNNNPFNVIRFLRRPVQLEEGTLVTYVNDKGDGGKALFVVPDYMVPSLRDLVNVIDRPALTTSAGDKYIYVQLRHRRASVTDPDFLETAASFSTGDGSTFLVDPEMNALFLKDAPSGADTFVQALHDWLDVPTAMLDLTVKVYEIDATNDAQIGLDYMAWKNGPGANLFAVGAYAEHGGFQHVERVDVPNLPKNNFTATGYNYAYRYDVPSAFFDFLAVKGKARIMNEMKLAALNTREATLTAGDQILYYAVLTSDPSGVRDTGRPFQANGGRVVVGTTNQLVDKKLVPVETGLKLNIVPTIGEQTVEMDLALEWSDFSFVDDTGFPQINRRSLTSRLRGKLGEEIIIGGLERQTEVKGSRKAPILGSLPLVGYAFGGENSTTRKTQLVVVITPSAVMKYNLAKTEAERDYRVKPGEQRVIDQASGTLDPKTGKPLEPVVEPKLGTSDVFFDQFGLDKEYGAEAEPLK